MNNKQYKLELGPKLDELITELAREKNIDAAELIRRAVGTYAYLNKETEGDGVTIGVLDSDDKPLKKFDLP